MFFSFDRGHTIDNLSSRKLNTILMIIAKISIQTKDRIEKIDSISNVVEEIKIVLLLHKNQTSALSIGFHTLSHDYLR